MKIITVNDIEIEIIRKDIKNIYLRVYPPDGKVRVSVPRPVDDEAIRLFIVSKISWIREHRGQYLNKKKLAEPKFISGENHLFLGRNYVLNIIFTNKMRQGAKIRDKKYIDLFVREGALLEQRKYVMQEWYREELKKLILQLIQSWEPIIGVKIEEFGIKQMKTRWGSCNVRAKRIWLNLELAKKSHAFLEYIVVHEMVHLLERLHNKQFKAYMDRFLPNWRSIEAELDERDLY